MWRFAGATATGVAHLKIGMPGQDRWRCLAHSGDTLISVVADGAGSAARAELGAEIATDTVVDVIVRSISSGQGTSAEVLASAALEAREAVLAAARREGMPGRELASTLLAVVIGPAGGAALQIGDGVIVVTESGEDWSWVFWPQRGEYANTTRFLTDDDALSFLQVETFAGRIQNVALMTDGIEHLALHQASRAAHGPFFNALFAPLLTADGAGEITPLSGALEAFLVSPEITSRADDDVTFVMATRHSRPSSL